MIKCPECGAEIPDGQMYCAGCGFEVKLVPEFEPEIENRIDKTLSKLADKIDDTEKKDGSDSRERKKKDMPKRKRKTATRFPFKKLIAVACLIAVCVILVVTVHKTTGDYVRLAEKEASRGNGVEAVAYLEQAIGREPKNAELFFQKAAYERDLLNDPDSAVKTLYEIINSAAFAEEDVRKAYAECADIYLAENNHAALRDLLVKCPFPDLANSFAEVMPDKPTASPDGGTFAGEVRVTLSAQDNETIYYTLNGEEPDETTTLYERAIVLEEEGEQVVKAVAVSADGFISETASFSYTLEKKPVPQPNVLEDSGRYTEPTKIVVTAGKDLKIYYTTDEEETPSEDSERYTGPIDMPEGDSVFCFVAIDEDGRVSETVIRRYTLEAEQSVSAEQAVLNVKLALIAAGYMADESGRVNGMDGYLGYAVDNTVTIGNDGSFYYIREIHVHADGSQQDTGRLYAVHTESGMTRRLGYDSNGKIMLMQF